MPPLASPDVAGHEITDIELAAGVADRVAVPRSEPADSFVLHAPLELLARTALLPYVESTSRAEARDQISELGNAFDRHDAADLPDGVHDFAHPAEAVRQLTGALDAGELDDTDGAARWLASHLNPLELADALADSILSSLAAAAHAPIFFWLAPRATPRWQLTGHLLRPLVRELARNPGWSLRWIDERPGHSPASADEMTRALAATPLLGEGPSNFIFPTMSRVDTPDLAPAILAPVCGPGAITERSRAITRVAAWSMLSEPTTHAAYGWSHALTMSQAALGIARSCADPSRALSTAATFVFGFRASLAINPLVTAFEAAPPRVTLDEALATGPDEAAAAAWHVAPEGRRHLATRLATRASVHPDAHLAKYTLACLDAAGDDPAAARLYLTAAAKLVGHWSSMAMPTGH